MFPIVPYLAYPAYLAYPDYSAYLAYLAYPAYPAYSAYPSYSAYPAYPSYQSLKFTIMSKVITGLYYSESHEFVKVDGTTGYIGITDFAQQQLGNVVYVDTPEVGDEVTAGEEFGAVESVKAASDLISPVSGTVEEVNEALEDQPELINQDAFANWIIKVTLSDPSELDKLMDAAAYESFCEKK